VRYLLLLLVLFPSVASAQIQAYYLPKGMGVRVGSEDMRCFNLDEGKELYRLDHDLYSAKRKVRLLEDQLQLNRDLSDLRLRKVELADVIAKSWESEYKRVHLKWADGNRLLHECQEKVGKTEWTSTHWLVLGGEVAVIAMAFALLFGGG